MLQVAEYISMVYTDTLELYMNMNYMFSKQVADMQYSVLLKNIRNSEGLTPYLRYHQALIPSILYCLEIYF